MEHLVTRGLPDCEELLFQHADETTAAAKATLSLGLDGLQLEALHQERHQSARQKCASRNKANYEVEISRLEEMKASVEEREERLLEQLQQVEEKLLEMDREFRKELGP